MKHIMETKQKGYAILFTVVLVGIISIIAIGLSNSTYKQLLLSSVAKDSQVAFYQADMASDCGIYADNIVGIDNIPSAPATWPCGGYNLTKTIVTPNILYTLEDTSLTSTSNPCFLIVIDKTTGTLIRGKGYNICDKSNIRTVEREINVTYQ